MQTPLQSLLDAYALAQPRRAYGGIYAMAGFVFQAELALSRAVAVLTAGQDFAGAGQVLVEALSDIAQHVEGQPLVLLQVKRTLTAAALDSAAAEIASIEAVDGAQAQALKPHYGVVCQFHDVDLDWAKLPKGSAHAGLIQDLRRAGRLQQPMPQANPRWEALSTLWRCHGSPFGFMRYALERMLRRGANAQDAQQCWDDIAERFRQGQPDLTPCGQVLTVADVTIASALAQRLEVGQRVAWHRWRAGQYMARPDLSGPVVQEALQLADQAQSLPSSELTVLWLSGRSGAGKSVLLLDTVSQLVLQGRRVLWLKPDEVQPALQRLAQAPIDDVPDFLAVDDVYDPDARSRLDIGRISITIDDAGARPWPVMLSCGPTEFAQQFEADSRYQGFKVQAREVPLLDEAQARQYKQWAGERHGHRIAVDGADPWQGAALTEARRGEGLFVSVALELAEGDMRQFGHRFADRLGLHGPEFAARIRQCLAVNRLYLRAPATWLHDSDRAHLEAINQDGDFALEAGAAGQEWLRLTHPHLSDAIYPHLLQAPTPQAYARDLGEVFERSLQGGHTALAQRLLQAFSAAGGADRAQRLQAVDQALLAQRCVQAWKACAAGGDARRQADMRVSWACWSAAWLWLGETSDTLIVSALADMATAEAQFDGLNRWPAWWSRLWAAHPGHSALRDWAVDKLQRTASRPASAWSRVWDAVWDAAQGERQEALMLAARQWLLAQGQRADWHFVWKKLRAVAAQDRSLTELLSHALVHPQGSHWAHVWQEALPEPPSTHDLQQLLAQGCAWLNGREDKDQWAFVWQALLARAQDLPTGWDAKALVALGCAWLEGREDKDQWAFVWQALLARAQDLPTGWDPKALMALGCAWLEGREDKDQWTFVWEVLLARAQDLPTGWDPKALVALGCAWLEGREDKDQWKFVWEVLLERAQDLPTGWDAKALVALGCAWLEGREDKDQWTFVWEVLLARAQNLPEGWNVQSLADLAIGQLTRVESADAALPVLKHLLKHWSALSVVQRDALGAVLGRWITAIASLPAGPASHFIEAMLDAGLHHVPGLCAAAVAWCGRADTHPSWPLVAVKSLRAWPLDPALGTSANKLAELISLHPNASWHYKADQLLGELDPSQGSAEFRGLVAALRGRKQWPQWDRAEEWQRTSCTVTAQVAAVGRRSAVELPGGLLAVLNPVPPSLRPGQTLAVVVIHVDRARDRVTCRPEAALDELPGIGQVLEGTISGHQLYGVFVRVGTSVGLILRRDLPANREEWPDLLPLKSCCKVRVTQHKPEGFNAVLVDAHWAPAEQPVVGQLDEAAVTGYERYGVFVKLGGATGLIHRSQLPIPSDEWPVVFPLQSRWRVRVVSHAAKGFGAELVNPPWGQA